MHALFLLARTFPWWAVPMALVVGQLTVFFWRRRSPMRFFFGGATLTLLFSAALWIIYRGDLHSDRWVRNLFLE
ncbi:MAG: hypothetical protein NDJ90_02835 [Oligoflexia bacterium]|nr:hypothetical protein [Oligoflexia bacterium]